MKLRVYLRDTVTGHLGVREMDYDEAYLESLDYMFRDGNYGCDCNRHAFLAEANPAFDDAVDEEIPCNLQGNRIAIDLITSEDGQELYRDER